MEGFVVHLRTKSVRIWTSLKHCRKFNLFVRSIVLNYKRLFFIELFYNEFNIC
jgi:hypothetical protein